MMNIHILITLFLLTFWMMIFSLMIGVYLNNSAFLIIGVVCFFALVLIFLEIQKHNDNPFY